MKSLISLNILPQYVRYTQARERFPDGKEYPLHRIQQLMRDEFFQLPRCTILTAPTGTGKSYAFPFPVLKSKEEVKDLYSSPEKSLIVLPTNALIQELTTNFQQAYPQVKTTCLNGPALDALEKRGFQRFEAMREIAKQSDIVITNPDLLTYALQGGYHQGRARRIRQREYEQGRFLSQTQQTGRRNPANFLEHFSYLIFDEYHLFDEAQIANVLTFLMLREAYLGSNHPMKFLFASATPEPALKNWLKLLEYPCQEVIEPIVNQSEEARTIHGSLQVKIHPGKQMLAWLEDRLPELLTVLAEGQRALVIFDRLNELQAFGRQLALHHPELLVYESSGYVPKDEDSQAFIKQAQLILATNKAEVGVNYEVTYCLMQPGRYFQNFVQRFGRVARGDQPGTIHFLLDSLPYRKLSKHIPSPHSLSYYDFLEAMQAVLQASTFHKQSVPLYLGELLWCVRRNLLENQDFASRLPLERFMQTQFWASEVLRPAQRRFQVLEQVNRRIQAIVKLAFPAFFTEKAAFRLDRFLVAHQQQAYHPAYQWAQWWHTYLQTYLRFRDGGHTVELYDHERDQVLDYRLDWVLQYRQIIGIETREEGKRTYQRYLVGGEKERDRDLQYHVNTIPWIGEKSNELLTFEQVNRPQELKKAFLQGVAAIRRKHLRGIDPLDAAIRELMPHLVDLGETFTRKRLNIQAIFHHDAIL